VGREKALYKWTLINHQQCSLDSRVRGNDGGGKAKAAGRGRSSVIDLWLRLLLDSFLVLQRSTLGGTAMSSFSRRQFVKTTAISTAALAGIPADSPAVSPRAAAEAGAGQEATVKVEGDVIHVETRTLKASLHKGLLVSLFSKATGEEFLPGNAVKTITALQLIYPGEGEINLDESKYGKVETRQVSRAQAEIIFHCWEGDGVLSISADPASGDLLVEPSAYSSRPGLQACRWLLRGLRPDLQLVAPFYQGIKLPLHDSLIHNSRWSWPMFWEAGLAIFQSTTGGFWVHCQDSHYRYKALKIGSKEEPDSIGLDSEAYGPLDQNLSAGGLTWRINAFSGDWKIPASSYRDWLWKAYGLQEEEKRRADWIHQVTLALSWCPGNPDILDALAGKIDPHRILIHFPGWRTDPYDQNYPTFEANASARTFISKGQKMGFRIMPHFNAVDMDPIHPVYQYVRDFQYRDLEHRRIQGWSWKDSKVLGVPESNATRLQHRDKNVMVKIHPGLSMWRSILGENIQKAARDLALETLFIDVTLTAYNMHNCWVESTTPNEGMKKLIHRIASLDKGLTVGGEGLNEITMQGLSFAQAHLFKSHQSNSEGLERAGGCALNEFLFGRLCRTIGYSGLGGRTPEEALRMRIHEEHNAIPTLTVNSAREITSPNPAVQKVLERALELSQEKTS
jgi:hypothetical protein